MPNQDEVAQIHVHYQNAIQQLAAQGALWAPQLGQKAPMLKTAGKPKKTKLGPLEINVAAKEALPFYIINTVEEFKAARAEGRLLQYTYAGLEYTVPVTQFYSDPQITNLLNKGVKASKTSKVYIHVICVCKDEAGNKFVKAVNFHDIDKWNELTKQLNIIDTLTNFSSFVITDGLPFHA